MSDLASRSSGEPSAIPEEPTGLPPDESPQRDAVCDALTDALLYLGVSLGEACESETINLSDRVEVRGLARMLTIRDNEGLDGSLGENTKKLWERIAAALSGGIPRSLSEEPSVWVVLDSEGLPEAVYCREDTAREYADDPNENKAGEGPFTVARFVLAASSVRLDGKPDTRDADGLISGDPLRRDGGELAMLRELATVAREYFDEKNRPAVTWDGMPSVQEQQRRRARIVELLASAASLSVIPTTVDQEPMHEDVRRDWERIARERADVDPESLIEIAAHALLQLCLSSGSPIRGDCPTEPAFSVELLEGLVEELASRSAPLPSSERAVSDGVSLIAAERKRQVEKEGWTQEHDDTHARAEMAIAAACYAANDTDAEVLVSGEDAFAWGSCYDKRKTHPRIRQLAIAGALIAAEIDRLSRIDRLVPSPGDKGSDRDTLTSQEN